MNGSDDETNGGGDDHTNGGDDQQQQQQQQQQQHDNDDGLFHAQFEIDDDGDEMEVQQQQQDEVSLLIIYHCRQLHSLKWARFTLAFSSNYENVHWRVLSVEEVYCVLVYL